MMKRVCILFVLLAGSAAVARAQQQPNIDWAVHDVGAVRQVLSNIGSWNAGGSDYPGLLNTEFPLNSFEEHMGSGGIMVGGIPESGENAGDTLVSVTNSFSSPNEFYPGRAKEDSIWVVERGDTLAIPYAVPRLGGGAYEPSRDPGYAPVADQDLVMHYTDDGPFSLRQNNHEPLYLDVVQVSHAWGSPPLDEVIVYNYQIVPTRVDLENVYVAIWVDANVGYRTVGYEGFAFDDYAEYREKRHLGIGLDAPGSPDGKAISPIGVRVYPPEGADSLDWTFNPYTGPTTHSSPPRQDGLRYAEMAEGVIHPDQVQPYGAQYMVAFGPVDAAAGDTLRFSLAEVLGDGVEGMMENVDVVDRIAERDFEVPAPPPAPTLNVTTRSGGVDLSWEANKERIEGYTDPNRADSVEQPFEGYQIWKSTQTRDGPWTLLGTFDVAHNSFGSNSGLRYTYTDKDLVNNVEYFYAVTAFSKPDTVLNWPRQSTSITADAKTVVPGSEPPDEVGRVAVVPNPYRGDLRYQDYNPPWEKPPGTRERWREQDRRLQFINLPQRARIKIYTLDGTLVQTLRHDSATRGYEDWDLISRVGQAISSGIYLFTVENLDTNHAQTGKFVVIK